MVYRIFGGLFLLGLGINYYSAVVPAIFLAVLGVIAGVALLAGI